MVQLSVKNIKAFQFLFHIGFISVILFQLGHTAFYTLMNNLFFFLTSDAIENLISAIIAYALYYFVFKWRNTWQSITIILFFVFMLSGLAVLKDYRIHKSITFDQASEYFTNFLGKTLMCYLLVYIINKLNAINHYRRLQHELKEAKENLLRNQMHPHFLFNAFNSLYSLCLKNSSEAAEYVLKLSGMMRYLTDEINLRKVPLSRELDFIKKYIAIEKMRFGKDAAISLVVNEHIDGSKLIEPFLLITLVENAFKHGFYTNSKDAFVAIAVNLRANELLFSVENSFSSKQHFQESNREGKGLDNLKQRLHLLYPKKSNFKTRTVNNIYSAQLKISLTE